MPTKFEQNSRTQHTSSTGIEITRTFYVESYDEFKDVTAALQGAANPFRPPARDTYIKNAYCNEVLVDFAHPDAMASSDSLEGAGGNLIDQLEDVPEKTTLGSAGAKIVAHYRPLVTAWQPSEGGPFSANPAVDIWDWMDPIIHPGIKQVPWPGGIYATAVRPGFNTFQVPDEVATPIGIGISDVSIRRLLVPETPHDAIAQCANAVNRRIWPNNVATGVLPNFPARTLKFQGTDVANRFDSTGRRWVELTHNFKWLHHWTDRLFDRNGSQSTGWVTWNHGLMSPLLAMTGWYEEWLGAQRFLVNGVAVPNIVAGLTPSAGRLHNEVDFTVLFRR